MTAPIDRARTAHGVPDDGQVMLLMIFFALIIAGLVTVIVDVSTVFLAQREMQSTADGAALDAVQEADLASIYGGNAGADLPMNPERVRVVATSYAMTPARVPHECATASYAVARADVETDGQTVTLQLTCKVPLPFVNVISSLWSDGVTIAETAHARSAVTALGP